jgi:hypothetical protein
VPFVGASTREQARVGVQGQPAVYRAQEAIKHCVCVQDMHKHCVCVQDMHKHCVCVQDMHKHCVCVQDMHKYCAHAQDRHKYCAYVQDTHKPCACWASHKCGGHIRVIYSRHKSIARLLQYTSTVHKYSIVVTYSA